MVGAGSCLLWTLQAALPHTPLGLCPSVSPSILLGSPGCHLAGPGGAGQGWDGRCCGEDLASQNTPVLSTSLVPTPQLCLHPQFQSSGLT